MDDFDRVIERAERLLDVGRPDEAAEILSADGRTATDARALAVLSRAAYQRDDYDGAVGHAERALALDPDLVGGWQMLALSRLATNRPVDAVPASLKAVALAPMFSGAHAVAARAHAELGRFDQATFHAHKAMELDPDGPRGWIALTRVQLAQQRWEDAAQSALAALGRDPESAEARVLLSVAQASAPGKRGRELAMATLVETLRDNPDEEDIRRFLIDVSLGSLPDRRLWLILIAVTFFTRGLGLILMLIVLTVTVISTWRSIPPDIRRLVWADKRGRYRVIVAALVIGGLWAALVTLGVFGVVAAT